MDLTVRPLGAGELSELYRLRYEIFRTELGAQLKPEDIDRGYLQDKFDEIGINYGLFADGGLIGSLRIVDLGECGDDPPTRRYPMRELFRRYPTASVCHAGRFALLEMARSTQASILLMRQALADGRKRGLRVAVSDCSPYLLPLYNGIGYRRFGDAFNDPMYGLKYPIVLILDDVEFLRLQSSPILQTVENLPADSSASAWYAETYPTYAATSTQLSGSPAKLDEILGQYLGTEVLQRYALFRGFSAEERRSLLRGGTVFDARQGDVILRAGLKEANIVMILSGTVDVVDSKERVIASFGAGEFVGEMAFLTGMPRSSNVAAREACECLLLNSRTVAAMEEKEPRMAAKLMRNMARALAERLQVLALRVP